MTRWTEEEWASVNKDRLSKRLDKKIAEKPKPKKEKVLSQSQIIMKTRSNPFFKSLGPEDCEQVRLIEYVRDTLGLIIMHTPNESKKTAWERWYAKVMGIYPTWPDLFMPYAKNRFNGLYIEMKSESNTVYNLDGTLRADKIKQAATLEMLRKQGYKAEFACGFNEAKNIIDEYFNN